MSAAKLLQTLFSDEDTFRFKQLLAIVGSPEEAVKILNEALNETYSAIIPQQPELDCETDEGAVWDGEYKMYGPVPFYEGLDGPGGGRHRVTRRAVTPWDTLEVY